MASNHGGSERGRSQELQGYFGSQSSRGPSSKGWCWRRLRRVSGWGQVLWLAAAAAICSNCSCMLPHIALHAQGYFTCKINPCRFSGTRPVAGFGFGAPAAAAASPAPTSSTSTAAGDPLELSAQLDGELAQCLRHLSKRDTTTKMKALQVRQHTTNYQLVHPLLSHPNNIPWLHQPCMTQRQRAHMQHAGKHLVACVLTCISPPFSLHRTWRS